MLVEKRELLGFGRRFQDYTPPVRHPMNGPEPRHRFHGRLAVGGRQVGTLPICLLVAWHELWPVLAQHRHEMLACAVFEVEHSGPQSRGARGAGSLDHGLYTVRAI